MKNTIFNLLFGGLLAVAGALGGWFAAGQGAVSADDHAHEEEHGGEEEAAPALSEQTLENLGVTRRALKPGPHQVHLAVQARIERRPLAHRPVSARLGGTVEKVLVRPGDLVRGGAPLASVTRAAVPPPSPATALAFLQPMTEHVHETVHAYWVQRLERDLAAEELERIRKESGGATGLVPVQRRVELEQKLRRAQERVDMAIRDLHRFGLEDEQIEKTRGGLHPHHHEQVWQRGLQIHGLWNEAATAVLHHLPEAVREHPSTIPVLGELVARGLLDANSAAELKKRPQLESNLMAVSALLLQGYSLPAIDQLCREGELQPVREIKAPGGADRRWVVQTVERQDGQSFEAGDVLLQLLDLEVMHLRAVAVGDEQRALREACARGDSLRAEPLLEGSGPKLADLHFERLVEPGAGEGDRTIALLSVANHLLGTEGAAARSYALRSGMRYRVFVPLRRYESVFVVPAGAVTRRGPDEIVLVEIDGEFVPHPVHVLHRTAEEVVLADDGAIEPGEVVVTSGAFDLAIALEVAGGGGDAHHHHHH